MEVAIEDNKKKKEVFDVQVYVHKILKEIIEKDLKQVHVKYIAEKYGISIKQARMILEEIVKIITYFDGYAYYDRGILYIDLNKDNFIHMLVEGIYRLYKAFYDSLKTKDIDIFEDEFEKIENLIYIWNISSH